MNIYKNIVNTMRNNCIEWENPKHNDVNSQKRDGRLQLRPTVIALAGATQNQNKTSANNK